MRNSTDEEIFGVIMDDASEETLDISRLVFKGVTSRTPVQTGQTRASWNVAVGEPDERTKDEGSFPGKPRFPGHVTRKIRKSKANLGNIYITNAKPHIEYLEDGSPTTEASGMVSKTLASL